MTQQGQLIRFRGLNLGVCYTSTPGDIGDYITPPTAPEISNVKVDYKGVDITDVMKGLYLLDEITEMIEIEY